MHSPASLFAVEDGFPVERSAELADLRRRIEQAARALACCSAEDSRESLPRRLAAAVGDELAECFFWRLGALGFMEVRRAIMRQLLVGCSVARPRTQYKAHAPEFVAPEPRLVESMEAGRLWFAQMRSVRSAAVRPCHQSR